MKKYKQIEFDSNKSHYMRTLSETLTYEELHGWSVYKIMNEGKPQYTIIFERKVNLFSLYFTKTASTLKLKYNKYKNKVVNWYSNIEYIKTRRQAKTLGKFRKM